MKESKVILNSWQKAGLRRNRWCLVLGSSGSCYRVLSEQEGMASKCPVQLWSHYTGVTLSFCLFLIHDCYSSVALFSVPLALSVSLDLLYRSALVYLFFIHHSYWLSLAVQYLFLFLTLFHMGSLFSPSLPPSLIQSYSFLSYSIGFLLACLFYTQYCQSS